MISQNSEQSMQQSPHPNAQMMSSENCETEIRDTKECVSLQRKTKEAYQESLPEMSKPTVQIDEVPEEEFKYGEPLTGPSQPV